MVIQSNPFICRKEYTHEHSEAMVMCCKKDSLEAGDKVDGHRSRVLNKFGMLAGLCNMVHTLEFDSGNSLLQLNTPVTIVNDCYCYMSRDLLK